MQSVIRSASFSDISGLFRLSKSFPLASLPAKRERIQEILQASKLSFEKKIPLGQRRYVFVLTVEGEIAAASQILAPKGRHYPYFTLAEGGKALRPVTGSPGKNSLGGLVAAPEFRRSPWRLGRQIGLFRLLFMQAFSSEFTKVLEVSLTAPAALGHAFYNAIAKPPLPANFQEAFQLYSEKPHDFEALCAKASLKAIRLNPQAKLLQAAAAGAVHKNTLPAFKGLLKLGFQKTRRRHILDGGIFLEAERERLPFFRNIRRAVFQKGSGKNQGKKTQAFLWGGKTAEGGFEGGQAEGFLAKDGAFLSSSLPSHKEGERLYIAPFA